MAIASPAPDLGIAADDAVPDVAADTIAAPSADPSADPSAGTAADPIAQITAAVTAEAPATRVHATPWERHYITVALVLDALVAFVAADTAFFAWPGAGSAPSEYFALTLVFPVIWVAVIALCGGYEKADLSVGPEEFNRVGMAGLGLFALVAVVAWTAQLDVARGYVAIALLGATAGTMLARYALRKYVHHQRQRGRFQRRTLLVGTTPGVRELEEHLQQFGYHGFGVVGSVSTTGESTDAVEAVVEAVRSTQADSVAITRDHGLSADELRDVACRLERMGTNLYLAPSLLDVAGPRIAVHPVEGVSLLHVQRPVFSGFKRLVKDTTDFVLAAAGLVALAPVLLAVAVAIKVDSPGPVLFRQTRVGRLGEPFRIAKFRSMVADAETLRGKLDDLDEGHGPLFKSRTDPRVTRVGSFLRRTSLDELPQLWNVLMGDMSLVGPRPHLPDEVVTFGATSRRRLFVKPGITGLWQISGRSNLSWDESVRADLHYVENWSLGLDALILWKTVGAVVRGDGAY